MTNKSKVTENHAVIASIVLIILNIISTIIFCEYLKSYNLPYEIVYILPIILLNISMIMKTNSNIDIYIFVISCMTFILDIAYGITPFAPKYGNHWYLILIEPIILISYGCIKTLYIYSKIDSKKD